MAAPAAPALQIDTFLDNFARNLFEHADGVFNSLTEVTRQLGLTLVQVTLGVFLAALGAILKETFRDMFTSAETVN